MIVKGYTQQKSIDYNELFYPIVKHSSIKLLLAVFACYDLKLSQLDVKIVFLHVDSDEDKYMSQSKDYISKLSDGNFIYLLIYVNDMLIAYKSMNKIERLKN